MASDGNSTAGFVLNSLLLMAIIAAGVTMLTMGMTYLRFLANRPRTERIDRIMYLIIRVELTIRRWIRYHHYSPRHRLVV